MQKQIWFGGDYNPDQWPTDVWDEDVTLMTTANVNMATVGVFSWARIEPRPGEFDFEWLDTVMDKLHAGGIRVDLATATASPPPWLSRLHPEILPVTEDGTRLAVGSRQAYCPSSPVYREAAVRVVEAIANRYADHPALELWHVNNEYGCHIARCYCEVSALAFQKWLTDKYVTVERLNDAWGTSFWSQRYDSFDEIGAPSVAPYFRNPTQLLDFDRFSSAELLECYRAEVRTLRRISPRVPVTTNFMGFFKPVDYWAWASEVDVISDDSYPDPADPDSAHWAAMSRDLMRSLGNGAPWILMEQAAGAVNWRNNNARKRAHQMTAWSHQAVARGADGILFFQWRQSIVGGEKFHSAMLPHSGTDTQVWREVVSLGAQLQQLSSLVGSRVEARIAIVFDWDSWWAIEQPALPASLDYMHEVFAWHRQFTSRGLVVDFVRPGDGLDRYAVVVVPTLFTASDAELTNLASYADNGGSLVVTYQTGITDRNLKARAGGYLGPLQRTLGVWIEEFAPPAAADLRNNRRGAVPALKVKGAPLGGASGASAWAEIVRTIDARPVAEFDTHDDLQGLPAITRRSGLGEAWYVATSLDKAGLSKLVTTILRASELKLESERETTPSLEIVKRGEVTFVINHGSRAVTIGKPGTDLLTGKAGQIEVAPNGVLALSHAHGETTELVTEALNRKLPISEART